MRDKALTVEELIRLLSLLDPEQKLVFSDPKFGDFEITGELGGRLSEDNFVRDLRPIIKLRKR